MLASHAWPFASIIRRNFYRLLRHWIVARYCFPNPAMIILGLERLVLDNDEVLKPEGVKPISDIPLKR